MKAMGMRSFVITTDEDNPASSRTCEKLGCVLESTVDVPAWCRIEFDISARKRRYVYEISKSCLQKWQLWLFFLHRIGYNILGYSGKVVLLWKL